MRIPIASNGKSGGAIQLGIYSQVMQELMDAQGKIISRDWRWWWQGFPMRARMHP